MAGNKASHDSDYLDFSKLEKEVQNAVVSEEKYWQENEAKIRAVEQRVPTYDDFREMVLAAHLKPLDKKDKLSSIEKFTQVWNPSAQKFPKSSQTKEQMIRTVLGEELSEQNKSEEKSVTKLPGSEKEFILHWRHHCKAQEDKKQFLFAVGAHKLAEIFRVEIAGDLLGEFLECLHCFEVGEAGQVIEILETLTKSQRFSISLAFLSKKEKESGRLLFEELKACPSVSDFPLLVDKLASLESVYNKHW
ncbi:unnamed protein product [Candidula unifasciata]|uniref:Coiled-coil domain-containing protein 103 n=1 Tax=Candidula unifasciata TaxID=100452 RepID=A0A8S3ZA07_9EUPU|nr:unnamed protein product [Candidula unifasciata]